MELLGTGKMIQVSIDSHRGQSMRDMEFSLEFYVHSNRRKQLSKNDLVRIDRTDGTSLFFAMLDTRTLGTGALMCNVAIMDPEPRWTGGKRPVLLSRNTGMAIGSPTVNSALAIQKDWIEGYKVDFNSVWSIPKAEVAYIFYGHLVNQLTSYADITKEMLVSPENHIVSVSSGKMGKTSCGVMEEGDKVVVLIPVDTPYAATKDNGFGGQMPFNSQLLGSNGENIVTIDGVQYRAYGEMMTTEGEMFIYVN